MIEFGVEEAQEVGGGFSFGGWVVGQLLGAGVRYAWEAVISGQVDYSGIADSQGTYYNTVGA